MTSTVEKFINFCKSEIGRKIIDFEVEYIKRELKTCDKILNIGCGIGWLEEKFPHLNIIGLDSSEEMLAEARRRSNKTFVLGNAEKLGFEDGFFDVVTFITTLEFVRDYKRVVKEACRVLKSNGRLIALILNPKSKYFKNHAQREDSYFRRIHNTNLNDVENYVSKLFLIRTEYILGVKDNEVFDTHDKNFASLYVIKGLKR